MNNTNDIKDNSKEKLASAKDTLAGGVNETKKTIEEQIGNLKEDLNELKDQSRQWFNKESIRHSLHQCKEDIGGHCKKSTEKMADCISERPLKSALLMTGVGFLIGLIANRR